MRVQPWPLELRVRRGARVLEVDYDDGLTQSLPASLLRAMTPSAAERGHGGGAEAPLPIAFETIGLISAQAVGAYAVRLVFDDGHDTGLYTWAALRRFGDELETLTAQHRRLVEAKAAN